METDRFITPEHSIDELRATLCQIARMSNRLAKQLPGRKRADAYRIKIHAINALIEAVWAVAKAITPKGTVSIEIDSSRRLRLHIPLVFLQLRARIKVLEQTRAFQPPVRDPGEWE